MSHHHRSGHRRYVREKWKKEVEYSLPDFMDHRFDMEMLSMYKIRLRRMSTLELRGFCCK